MAWMEEEVPDGLTRIEEDPDDMTHPLDDDALTGKVLDSSIQGDEDEELGDGLSKDGDGRPDQRVVKNLGPSEYIKLLQDMGVRGNPKDWVVQYYKEQARPYLINFPASLNLSRWIPFRNR